MKNNIKCMPLIILLLIGCVIMSVGFGYISFNYGTGLQSIKTTSELKDYVYEKNLTLPFPNYNSNDFDPNFEYELFKKLYARDITEFTSILNDNYVYDSNYDSRYWAYVWLVYWKNNLMYKGYNLNVLNMEQDRIIVLVYNDSQYCVMHLNNSICYK